MIEPVCAPWMAEPVHIPSGDYLTVAQYAERVGLSYTHIARLCRKGTLDAVKVGSQYVVRWAWPVD